MPLLTGWSEALIPGADPSNLSRLDDEVVELPLLLPRWHASALEEVAQSRGMTTGQLIRRYLTDLLEHTSPQTRFES